MTKIVCLGAGSHSFGLSTLLTLLHSERLRGSEICLVDINAESLEIVTKLANWLNSAWDCQKVITSYSNHKEALPGADFVISAIEVQPREALWQKDFELTLKYGLRQPYAENGGPGGFAHAARNVNTVLAIAKDMETLCPQAWFINFTNPMHRVCYLISAYTKIKVVGLCHQLGAGYAMAAKALAPDLGVKGADAFVSTHADPKNHEPMKHMAQLGQQNLRIVAAGLNHFTWMLSLEDRRSGQDLYPLFRQRFMQLEPQFEPLTREVFEAFSLFPIPGDEHLCEYLPWVSSARTTPWARYDLSLYDWKLYANLRDQQWAEVAADIERTENQQSYSGAESEGAVEVIEGLLGDSDFYWEALNLPNHGLISNLPNSAIVELPGTLCKGMAKGMPIGELPKGVTGLLQREVMCSQLCVDAVVEGDHQMALQSLLLDPVIDDLGTARQVLDDILTENRAHLPQFWD